MMRMIWLIFSVCFFLVGCATADPYYKSYQDGNITYAEYLSHRQQWSSQRASAFQKGMQQAADGFKPKESYSVYDSYGTKTGSVRRDY